MKKGIILLFFIFKIVLLNAQQYPIYTQYSLNKFALNPALAGIKRCSETAFTSRRQWAGFEGAPFTNSISFNTRLNKEDKYPRNFHGVGGQIMNDKTGFTNNIHFKIAYAYHMKLRRNFRLSVGIYAGVQRLDYNISTIKITNKSLDPAINSETNNAYVYPEVSPGIYLYNRKFFAGFSSFQIYPAKTGDLGTHKSRLRSHYFLMGGYRFTGRTIDVIPSILVSFRPVISPTVDFTLTFDYQNKLAFALGSKYLNSVYASINFKIAKTIGIGYAYEYALNELNQVAPSTHEIVLTISTCSIKPPKARFHCPAYQ